MYSLNELCEPCGNITGPIHDDIDSTSMMMAGILLFVLTFQRAVWSLDDRKLENPGHKAAADDEHKQVNWLLNLEV